MTTKKEKAFDFRNWLVLDGNDCKAIHNIVRKACGATVKHMISEYSSMSIELPRKMGVARGLPNDYCVAVAYCPNERDVVYYTNTLDELIDEVIDMHQLHDAENEELAKFSKKLRQLADKIDNSNTA